MFVPLNTVDMGSILVSQPTVLVSSVPEEALPEPVDLSYPRDHNSHADEPPISLIEDPKVNNS